MNLTTVLLYQVSKSLLENSWNKKVKKVAIEFFIIKLI